MNALLKLLQDGRFHSGEELGTVLGVSRAAVWKRLQRFEEDFGIVLHRVRGKGYQLSVPLSLLDEGRLLPLREQGWQLFVRDVIDSTNSEALRLLERGVLPPYVVMAEQQTAGRGRRGRHWVSPYGQNLFFSLMLRVTGGARQLEGLSLTVGLAVHRTLMEAGLAGVLVKWPNDILVDNRKIAGILLELNGDPADNCQVQIGIGINLNMPADGGAIGQSWTSLYRETGCIVDRNVLACSLGRQLQRYLSRHRDRGFAGLRQEWEKVHAWQGCRVNLISGTGVISGRAAGVSEQGALILDIEGRRELFNGGELSLRLQDDS